MRRIRFSPLFSPLFAPILLLPLHVGHGEELLRQRAPRWVLFLYSRYEHLIMRAINYLASREWIHRRPFLKRQVDRLTALIVRFINGEIITLEEARRMISAIADHGYTIAVGTCPCRRARNIFSDRLPNNTDMVFGPWAEEYLRNYPGLYERLDKEEALARVEDFDRLGFVHQIYGWPPREGAAYVLCNCCPDVCIPMRALRERGYDSFRKGRSVAVVEEAACLGASECGVCLKRCPFEARTGSPTGKVSADPEKCYGCGLCVSTCRGEATRLQRKPGADLLFARHLVDA
jgi:ferredoxin